MKSITQYITEQLVNEGGAAGHMLHPYELPFVFSCADLVKWFESLESKLSEKMTKTFVKLDGVNCSIRVRDNEFVLDRMTKNPMDIAGMTSQDISVRFAGHEFGYDKYSIQVLDAFNTCFNAIKPELKKLGLIDNASLMFNVEFIDKKLNIINIGKHVIAIHGLLMIETNERNGSRKTYEVRGDSNVIEKIAKKMTQKLPDIEVITQEEAFLDTPINIKKVLTTPMRINYGDRDETKTLKEWLGIYELTDRKGCSVKNISNGKRVNTQSLQVLKYIYKGGNMAEMFQEKDFDIVLKNYFLQIATLMLGQEFLNNMNSRIGHLSKQEGIVVRDAELNQTDAPVKLTGYFVLHK